MNGVINWFARNDVAANLLMLMIMAAGALSIPNIKQEVFPEIDSRFINVSVVYPGAAPAEVEEAVNIRIEEEIQGLDGIETINSTARENLGYVVVEAMEGTDMPRLLDDVKSRVDAIDTFPEDVEEPVIEWVTNRRQTISVAVSGEASERVLKRIGEQVRDELSALDGITQVTLTSVRPYEISIEVSEENLRRYDLTFDDVVRSVATGSVDLPGGSIKTDGGEILLRTEGQAYRGDDFEDLVVTVQPDGSRVLVRDVATVIDGFADVDRFSRFNGESNVLVQVFQVGNQSALEISALVTGYVKDAQARMPEGITLTTWEDRAEVLRSRLDLLITNAQMGLVLVIIVLSLFLNLRLAFWVSLGIPICFLGALWMMPILDMSINLISLFAFILVLGIVVDDAIIVGENCFRIGEETRMDSLDAAIAGARQVGTPVIFAVLTTIAAFAPLLLVPGQLGSILGAIAMGVIVVLVFSLVESLLILPTHLAHVKHYDRVEDMPFIERAWMPIQRLVAGVLRWFIERIYKPSLEFALEFRYATIAFGIATLLVTVSLLGAGLVKFSFLPPVEADTIAAYLTMPEGTPVWKTADAIKRIEDAAFTLKEQLNEENAADGRSAVEHIMAAIGEQPYREVQQRRGGGGTGGTSESSANIGEVVVALAKAEFRNVSSQEIVQRWRNLAGDIPAAVELTYSANLFSSGDDVNVQLESNNIDHMNAATEQVKAALRKIEGVRDITDNFRSGKDEIELTIKPAAQVYGLTMRDLARQVRQAYYGDEVQRIQRGRDEVKVMVRYPEEARQSLDSLTDMRIRTRSGLAVPFYEVADVEMGQGFSAIRRNDRKRVINVIADVDDTVTTPNEVLAYLAENELPGIMANYPGMTYSFQGQRKEQSETLGGILRGFILALLIIYALLAIPLGSYMQPLVIMSAIPFGIVGAIWGHLLMGKVLTILSIYGIVALAGVVVNDCLVMVDFINHERGKDHDSLVAAIRAAGAQRFRPILLTSLTTFAGLSPLLLEKSVQAQFLIPMAISLGFGVIFATFISLILVPCIYFVIEDVQRFGEAVADLYRRDESASQSEPAPSEA